MKRTKNPREALLRVRLSQSELARLKQLAEATDLSMSALVRDHLGRVRVRNRSDERARIAMLNRINANLNMIARWVNTYKAVADTVEVVSHLIAIERVIKELAE